MNLDFIKESVRESVQDAIRTQVNEEYTLTDAEEAIVTEAMSVYGEDFAQLNETIKGRIVSGAGKITTALSAIGTVIMAVTIPAQLSLMANAGLIAAGAVGFFTAVNFVSLGITAIALIALWVGSDRLGKVLDVSTYRKLEKKLQKNVKKRDAVLANIAASDEESDKLAKVYERTLGKLTKEQQKIGMKMTKILDKNYESVRQVMPDNDFSTLSAIAVSAAEGKLTSLDELASKKVKLK